MLCIVSFDSVVTIKSKLKTLNLYQVGKYFTINIKNCRYWSNRSLDVQKSPKKFQPEVSGNWQYPVSTKFKFFSVLYFVLRYKFLRLPLWTYADNSCAKSRTKSRNFMSLDSRVIFDEKQNMSLCTGVSLCSRLPYFRNSIRLGFDD